MTEELNEQEKKLLKDLVNHRKNLRKNNWKKSLQKGVQIPDEGLQEKLPGTDYTEALDSLQQKGIIKIEEKETVVDRTEWNIDYEKDGETLEKDRNIRGSEKKKYLKIAENKIEKLPLEDL